MVPVCEIWSLMIRCQHRPTAPFLQPSDFDWLSHDVVGRRGPSGDDARQRRQKIVKNRKGIKLCLSGQTYFRLPTCGKLRRPIAAFSSHLPRRCPHPRTPAPAALCYLLARYAYANRVTVELPMLFSLPGCRSPPPARPAFRCVRRLDSRSLYVATGYNNSVNTTDAQKRFNRTMSRIRETV